MTEEPWKQLHQYWLSKHIDGRPPARKDIDPPLEIPHLLPNLMLLEKTSSGDFRYRLVGTAVEARSGTGMTGRILGVSEISSQLVPQWRAGLAAACEELAPKLFVSRMPRGIVARYIGLILPLVRHDGQFDQILAGGFFDGYVDPGTRVEGMEPIDMGP